jgi:hypothetical protein
LRHRLVVAEHDARQDRAALPRRSALDRALDVRAQSICDREEPCAPADDAPAVGPQDDVDASASQPGPLVEAVITLTDSRRQTLGHRIVGCAF